MKEQTIKQRRGETLKKTAPKENNAKQTVAAAAAEETNAKQTVACGGGGTRGNKTLKKTVAAATP